MDFTNYSILTGDLVCPNCRDEELRELARPDDSQFYEKLKGIYERGFIDLGGYLPWRHSLIAIRKHKTLAELNEQIINYHGRANYFIDFSLVGIPDELNRELNGNNPIRSSLVLLDINRVAGENVFNYSLASEGIQYSDTLLRRIANYVLDREYPGIDIPHLELTEVINPVQLEKINEYRMDNFYQLLQHN